MYDANTKTFSFPDVVPIHHVSRKFTFDDIKGGFLSLAKIGKKRNEFLGGNCSEIGLIPELGLYACPKDENNNQGVREIMALYVTDGKMVTPAGREVIRSAFSPTYSIVYGDEAELAEKDEENKKIKASQAAAKKQYHDDLVKKLLDLKVSASDLGGLSDNELAQLLAAKDSGKSGTGTGGVVDGEVKPLLEPGERAQVTKPINAAKAKAATNSRITRRTL